MAVAEVLILRNDDAILGVCVLRDLAVGRTIPMGEPGRVHGIVPCSVQELAEPGRQLGVDQELHAADSGTTRPPAARAPNSRAARMSSRSRSG